MRNRWTYAGFFIFVCLLGAGALAASVLQASLQTVHSELRVLPLEDHRMLAGVIQTATAAVTSIDALQTSPSRTRYLAARIDLDRATALATAYRARMPHHPTQVTRRTVVTEALLAQLQSADAAVEPGATDQEMRLLALWSRLRDTTATLTDIYLRDNTTAVASLSAQSSALSDLRANLGTVLTGLVITVSGTGVLLILQVSTSRSRERARAQLAQQKTTLETTLAALRNTQAQLVESEKLAALGGLVAGVAHEVNTPVGVTLTAATALNADAAALQGKVAGGKVRKSDVQAFLARAQEATGLMQRNCERAAHLIQSFKQVSVDQISDERRQFAITPYIHETIESLGPVLKPTQVTVVVDGPDGAMIDSYPGAIGQIITNLITNALHHAYDGNAKGCVHINVEFYKVDWFSLSFSDDGRGVAEIHVPRLFDPFFTTRRGEGGSGLGLHIVHNLVAGRLGGAIRYEPTPGGGATFVIEAPTTAPAHRTGGDETP